MKIHKEGYKNLRNQGLLIIITIIIINYGWISNILLYIQIILFLLTLRFFRIPKRNCNKEQGIVYSPCDGKIVVIEETIEKEFYKDKRIQISIFMSPLNVHNQLYPIGGDIKYRKYHPGKFWFAWHPKASTDNERSTIVIEDNKISILLRQIAGALARRIITYSNLNETVQSGDELGFIKFGSRVDLFFPIGTQINIKLNDKVVGGETIIANY